MAAAKATIESNATQKEPRYLARRRLIEESNAMTAPNALSPRQSINENKLSVGSYRLRRLTENKKDKFENLSPKNDQVANYRKRRGQD